LLLPPKSEKMESLEIAPVQRIQGTVKLPGSKSLSNRILLLAALAEGTTNVQNLLVSTCSVLRDCSIQAHAHAVCLQLHALRARVSQSRRRAAWCTLQDSEDIRYMVGALEALGVQVVADWAAGTAVVHGCAGRFPVEGAELFLGNAGTAMRCEVSLPRWLHACSHANLHGHSSRQGRISREPRAGMQLMMHAAT
jgi:3-phosphoshikimate 1-carboxyvinyltransferase